MIRWLVPFIALLLPLSATAESCGVIDTTYGIYSGEKLKIDEGVKINGNNIVEDDYDGDTGLQVGGGTESAGLTIPGLDPASFPSNKSKQDLDEDDSPLDGSSEIYIDKIDVDEDETFTFTGSGPFHIDELKADEDSTINFSPGVYYIKKFKVKEDSVINISPQVRIHIGDKFEIDEEVDLNASGNPEDLLIFLHEDSKFKAKEESTIVGVIIGVDNKEVKFEEDVSFTGVILTDGKVELKEDVRLTLSPAQQLSIGDESTCESAPGGAGADHFSISHDNNGIHCLAEVIIVTARDSAGDPVLDYEGQVTLDTQSSFGSFSLASGSGILTDTTLDDGFATYDFDLDDEGVVSLSLTYRDGPPALDIDVYQTDDTVIRDDDTEAALVFAPTGFTVTATALSNPPPATINDPIPNQTAGTTFSLYIAAYGETPEDATCGVIESYAGDKSLSFWMDYANPSSGILVATIDGGPISSSEGASSVQIVNFEDGQADVTAKYKDVGQIQIEMKDSGTRGATNPFVVSPADFVVIAVTDSSDVVNPEASHLADDTFVAAGELFRVTVEVRDAEDNLTPNYGNESTAEGITLVAANLVAPLGGRNGSNDDGAIANAENFVATLTAGTFRNTDVSWNEIGIIQLQASVGDGDYLGAGDMNGTLSDNVGRFSPASFTLVSSAVAGYCSNSTYMDQPDLGVSYLIEARGSGGNRLQNYDLSLLGSSLVSTLEVVAENNNSGVDLGGRIALTPTAWLSGRLSLASSNEQFNRSGTPNGPYSNLQLGLRLLDLNDGLSISAMDMNALNAGDCSALANCDAKQIGGSTAVVYGRLEVQNAFGPETAALDVGLRLAYFDTTGNFAAHSADSCTTYVSTDASLGNYQGGLPAVSVISPGTPVAFSSGVSVSGSGLLLSAPGATNTGSVDVTYDAAAWLEYDWAGAGNEDPTGTAIFGQFRGHDKVIYWREVY